MHKHSFKHWLGTAAMAASLTFGAMGSAQAADDTIEFGWTAWSDAEFITKLAKQVIEEHTDYNVKLTLSAIGVQYQGVANGDLDAMLMAWLPDTHADYYDKFENDVENLGTLYEDARLGWVVPSYVPEDQLASISDLKKPGIADKLSGKIQGIDPGAGLMQLSNKTMDAYGLGDSYRLVSASGAAMTAALSRAYDNKDWIVVTGWTPHWMFARWDLKYLDDPKKSFGEAEHINTVVHNGLEERMPEAYAILDNFHWTPDQMGEVMLMNQEDDSDPYENAKEWVAENQDVVQQWLPDAE